MKQEYRKLRDVDRTAPEEQRFSALAGQLQDLPEWTDGIGGQPEIEKALRDISSKLGSS